MKHRLQIIEKSKTGWPQLALIIQIDKLDKAILATLPRYLIDHVKELVLEAKKDSDRMFPITIETSDGIIISEKLMWELVIENESDAQKFVLEYIDTLCNLVEQNTDNLFFNSEEYFAGSHAIFEYLDYFLCTDKSNFPTAIEVYDHFFKYLMNCDLEYEVHQDNYITKVLNKLIAIDKKKYFELLFFRLLNGQENIGAKDYRYLANFIGENTLKEFIDFVIETIDSTKKEHEAYIYIALLAVIYGTADDKIEDVMDYIRDKSIGKFEAKPYFIPKFINRIQAECDAYRNISSSKKVSCNTSFHTYDNISKKWLSQ